MTIDEFYSAVVHQDLIVKPGQTSLAFGKAYNETVQFTLEILGYQVAL